MREIRETPGLSKRFKKIELEAERKKPLSERVKNDLTFVASVLPDCEDWLVVKKKLMLQLPVDQRQLFSTRDPITKKHYPFNVFEQNVRKLWKELTGKLLLMPDDKKMDGAKLESYL